MSMHMISRLCLAGYTGVAVFFGLSDAFAQDEVPSSQSAQASTNVLEEVIVTSLRREQSLADTPAAVTAFTNADIRSIGVNSMRDYAKLVPNMLLVETQASNFAFVNIRGISQFRNTDPSVAVVIDGVLNTTGNGLSQELFDIEQIEVLKGPQGAIYGRNAIGGAINITTRKPTNEFEGFLKAGYGNGNAGRGQASLSGPLVEDKLFGRIAFNYYDDDGFRKNITTGGKGDASQNFSTRGRVVWDVSETFSADFRASYSRDRGNAGGFIDVAPIFHETTPGSGISLGQLIGVFGPASPQVAAGPTVGGASQCLPGPGNCPALQVPGQALNVGDFNASGVPLQVNLNGIDHRDAYSASVLLKADLGVGTLTSVSAFDRLEQYAVVEQPPRNAGAAQKNNQYRLSEAWSQEIRVSSDTDQRLRWIAGTYIVQTDGALTAATLRDKDGRDTLNDLIKLDPFRAPDGICVGNPFPINGPNDNQGNCVQGFLGDQSDNLAYAVFGEVSFDLRDNLEFIVSARWDRDEREQTVITPTSLTPPQLIALGAPLFGDKREANFDDFQPKATLKWTVNDQLMTYVTYAEGFRSGGFNQPGIEALADFNRPTSPVPIVLGVADVFDKQTTKGVELGAKFTTADRRLAFGITGFYTEVDNMPTFTAVTIGTILSQVVIPIDETELLGGELDATWLVTDGLQVTLGLGYTDSSIEKNVADPRLVGNKAPTTPEYTVNLGFQYTSRPVNLGPVEGTFFLRPDYQRIGPMFNNPGNFSERDDIDLLNIRAGFETADEWRFEAWVKNATDEDYFAEMFNPAGFGFPAKPRQYGFEISKRF